jgi:hypothetical protein
MILSSRETDSIDAKNLGGAPMTDFLKQGMTIPSYMAYPKFLLKKRNLSETEKLIYVLLLDRARLSMINEGWTDKRGRVYVNYTIQTLATDCKRGEVTVKTALRKLESNGLITRENQGIGVPSRIYVRVETEKCSSGRAENNNLPDRKAAANKRTDSNSNESLVRPGRRAIYDCNEDESL